MIAKLGHFTEWAYNANTPSGADFHESNFMTVYAWPFAYKMSVEMYICNMLHTDEILYYMSWYADNIQVGIVSHSIWQPL